MGHAIRPRDDLEFALPPRLEDWLSPDHPARFIRDVVAALDLAALGFRVRDYNEGLSPYAADLLLRVWLYGFFERFRSTRRLEWACRNVVALLWLTGNQPPDHNTLWRFFRAHKTALRALFRRVVQLAADAGLVGLVLHAIDGTKLQAACSSETAWHRDRLQAALARADAEIQRMLDGTHDDPAPVPHDAPLPPALRDAVARKAAIAAGLAALAAAETAHLHPGERDARMMQGRGTGTVLSYNAQVVADADHGLLVAADVTTEANDLRQLAPLLDATADTLGATAAVTVADAGYAAGEQLDAVAERGVTVCVAGLAPAVPAPAFDKANFRYDAARDGYVCPRGDFVPFAALTRKDRAGPDLAVYHCRNDRCPERHLCTRDPTGRRIDRTPFDDALDAQRARQHADPATPARLARRKAVIEVVFALVKWNHGFRRFTVRGLANVRAQWALVCTAINLRKLYAAWRAGALTLASAA
jgi:transposase